MNETIKRFGPMIIIVCSLLVFFLFGRITNHYATYRVKADTEALDAAYKSAIKESLESERAHCIICHRVRP